MQHFHLKTRRDFLRHAMQVGAVGALASLTDIPFVMKKALAAESSLGRNGKKLMFIFLRGANDSLNSVIPIQDDGYAASRPTLNIPKDPAVDYGATGGCDLSAFNATATAPTFGYQSGIALGNGFAALHPSLKFLAPVYNAGDLALIHRVAYPRQSRSHFDSQNYWETGNPNDNLSKDGIFYRTIIESGLANSQALTGISIQSSLPLILRGSKAAMTNLNDPMRFSLLGIPNVTGDAKASAALKTAAGFPYPDKMNRELLNLQYKNLTQTLEIFANLDFSQTFLDNENLDGESQPYNLFPTSPATNGGYAMHGNDPAKYVVQPTAHDFFNKLKNAAIVLNKTDAIIAGTQLDGFDTHSNQGRFAGGHPYLNRNIGWAMYALRKYFTNFSDKVNWDNLVVITLSEFGRTTVENSDAGTDHAEAGAMFVAGGAVKGYAAGRSGVFGCSPNDTVPWVTGQTAGTSSMFGASSRYLKRAYDYRSVLGRLIRNHLGASQEQVNRIIPGYAISGENLMTGGRSSKDGVTIMGEPDIV
ncbi:MAG TPA: DUF1501 domain-containing protein [Verrucomicrobiae bacterium]|nr:DUF1501 domain-containing protein [Verrucomicrobiae bacterium]